MARKKPGEPPAEQRRFERRTFGVPFRLVPRDRPADTLEGETLDVSQYGVAVTLTRVRTDAKDSILQRLVEDRQPVEVFLRLAEGSVCAEGHVTWWGLLGEENGVAVRAGVLLPKGWNARDWQLIQRHLK